MNELNIRTKRLREGARLPVYGSELAAGADLCAAIDAPVSVAPGETVFFPTGLAFELPAGYAGFVFARSGTASKRGLAPANKVGVIDADYRGEVTVALHNHGTAVQTVEPGERIAQFVVLPVPRCTFDEADELSDSARGAGGFGSTGRT